MIRMLMTAAATMLYCNDILSMFGLMAAYIVIYMVTKI